MIDGVGRDTHLSPVLYESHLPVVHLTFEDAAIHSQMIFLLGIQALVRNDEGNALVIQEMMTMRRVSGSDS